jgi:hypothetical protein
MRDARKIRPDDIFEVEKWYEDRGIRSPEPYDYPEIGFIVEDVAAVFLYQTDSSFAIIEGLISNKDASPLERDVAIDMLYAKIIEFAKNAQYTKLLALTQHNSVKQFLNGEDFTLLSYSTFMKEINRRS